MLTPLAQNLSVNFPWSSSQAFTNPLPSVIDQGIIESFRELTEFCTDNEVVSVDLTLNNSTVNLAEQFDVELGDSVFVVAEGKTPIDPASLQSSPLTLTYLSEQSIASVLPEKDEVVTATPPISSIGNQIHTVPVAYQLASIDTSPARFRLALKWDRTSQSKCSNREISRSTFKRFFPHPG